MILAFIAVASCRTQQAPPVVSDAAAPSTSASACEVPDASTTQPPTPPPPAAPKLNVVDAVAVSSRVDNATESPDALTDGSLDTAWSSKTGDLEGAWVAIRIKDPIAISAVLLTVGMTKTADLFVQNPRISKIAVSWTPLVGSKRQPGDTTSMREQALDIESRELQRVAVSTTGPGILKITVKSVALGTKPTWREATISEIGLEGPNGQRLIVQPWRTLVGSLDPTPRGALNVIPELPIPLGCTAVLPSGPRFYCFLGSSAVEGNSASTLELASVTVDGFTALAPLDEKLDARLPYAAWLRAEKDAKGARPLTGAEIEGTGSLTVDGITIEQTELKRQHEDTPVGNWDLIEASLEVRWPGATTDTMLIENIENTTASPRVRAWRFGNALLVQRLADHGSEGMSWHRADAAICDITKKTCIAHAH